METLNQLAVEDCRQNRECAAEDPEITDGLLGEMQLIRQFIEKRCAKSGRKIKQRNKKKSHPKIFRPHDGLQLPAGVLENHAASILSGRLLFQEDVSDREDRQR